MGGQLTGMPQPSLPRAYEEATTGRHQRLQAQMALLVRQRGGAGRHWREAQGRLQALDQAERIERGQAAADPRYGVDPLLTQRHAQHRNAVNAARLDEYARFAAPELRQWQQTAEQVAEGLHGGRHSFSRLAPGDLAAAIAHATDLDPQELRPGAPAVRAARDIVQAARRGDARMALPALNELYRRVLDGHVGQHLHDGSVIARVRIVGLHPNPLDPAHTTFAARLEVVSPDGRRGAALRPLMLDSGHLSLHPEQVRGHAVLSVPTDEFVHHTLALATAVLAAQHPQVQAQLDAVPDAQRQRNRALLDLSAALGSKSPQPQAPHRVLENGDIVIGGSDGAMRQRVGLPQADGAGLAEQYRQALERGDREGIERAGHALVQRQPGVREQRAAADPYQPGRLYLGHDGRRARYLGQGKWGAP